MHDLILQPPGIAGTGVISEEATFSCWDDFDITDTEDDLPNLPRLTVSDGSFQWSNFKNLIIGNR